jgi:tetrahydrodipicolinate N-succinyltransferase
MINGEYERMTETKEKAIKKLKEKYFRSFENTSGVDDKTNEKLTEKIMFNFKKDDY